MTEEILSKRSRYVARRQILEPGECTAWHTDSCHRFSVVIRGSMLAIEYEDTGEVTRFTVAPGEADWDEPTDRAHRAINVGPDVFEEVTLFLVSDLEEDPQPNAEPEATTLSPRSGS